MSSNSPPKKDKKPYYSCLHLISESAEHARITNYELPANLIFYSSIRVCSDTFIFIEQKGFEISRRLK